jgi:MFS transporter, DHA3 family, macrolide efflux protein
VHKAEVPRPARSAARTDPGRAVPERSIPWRRLAPAIVLFSQNRIISTIMNTLLVVLVIRTFHRGMGVLGLIDAIAGLGFALGALVFAPVHRRYRAASILVAGSALSAVWILPSPCSASPGSPSPSCWRRSCTG